jgi:signal peptidase II
MPHVKRSAILFLTVISCVGCDQTTKYTAKELLPPGSVIRLVNDTIRLQYIENSGAFLGLGASLSKETRFLIFTVLAIVAGAGLLVVSGLFDEGAVQE